MNITTLRLIEETKDFASSLLSTSLIVIHDAESGGEHNMTESTGGEDVQHPLLNSL
jgi:hypothetical protein